MRFTPCTIPLFAGMVLTVIQPTEAVPVLGTAGLPHGTQDWPHIGGNSIPTSLTALEFR